MVIPQGCMILVWGLPMGQPRGHSAQVIKQLVDKFRQENLAKSNLYPDLSIEPGTTQNGMSDWAIVSLAPNPKIKGQQPDLLERYINKFQEEGLDAMWAAHAKADKARVLSWSVPGVPSLSQVDKFKNEILEQLKGRNIECYGSYVMSNSDGLKRVVVNLAKLTDVKTLKSADHS